MYATVFMIYAVDFCHSFHASDATQNRRANQQLGLEPPETMALC